MDDVPLRGLAKGTATFMIAGKFAHVIVSFKQKMATLPLNQLEPKIINPLP